MSSQKSIYEDVYITKNNRIISVLTNPQMKALLEAKKMAESMPIDNSITLSDKEIVMEAVDKR